jgi:predicted transcriptional regulator
MLCHCTIPLTLIATYYIIVVMTARLLGSLESRIMEYFWRNPDPSPISTLHDYLNNDDDLAYTTVSTIVSRLVEKGLLSRKKDGRGYLYQAEVTEEQFRASTSRRLIKNLLGSFGDLAIAGFVDELRSDPQALKKLRELSK